MRISGPPRWLLAAGTLVCVLGAGLVWRSAAIDSRCESRISELQTALAQSNRDLANAPGDAVAKRCDIYLHRVDILAGLSAASSVCVAPLRLKADVWRNQDAERRAYENLAEQTCPPVGS